MNSPVDDIKNKLDVVDVVGSYVKLTKAGRNYRASCPFHAEKNPSFFVSPERQMWHCFSCNKGGSIFDFVMEIEGVEFSDALRTLAQRAGVELKKIDPKLKTEKSRLYEICNLASRFYVKQLEASQMGKKMKKYLASRGLKEETIKNWQIGYAPGGWRALFNFLKEHGYPESEIIKSGLAVAVDSREKQPYDRFRDRIVFPISDINGSIVGFTARENPNSPDSRMGKYINTPNTLIYDKGRILYGLDKAKLDIRKNGQCVIVEGQMDVIMSHQAGIKNVLASSGTALTEFQLRIIKRYTDNLAMAFDMDLAGQTAAKRGFDLAVGLGFNTKIISLADNKDPADCILANLSLWQEAIKKTEKIVEFYLKQALKQYDAKSVEGKKEISKMVLPLVKKIPNKVEQAHWLQEMASRLNVSENVLLDEMNKISDYSTSYNREAGNYYQNSQKEGGREIRKGFSNTEEYLLGLIISNFDKAGGYKKEPVYLFGNSEFREIFASFKKAKEDKKTNANFVKSLPANLSAQVNYLLLKTEAQKDLIGDFDDEKEIAASFNYLKRRYFRQRLSQLNLAIKEAEKNKDKENLKKLINQFNNLSKQAHFCASG